MLFSISNFVGMEPVIYVLNLLNNSINISALIYGWRLRV